MSFPSVVIGLLYLLWNIVCCDPTWSFLCLKLFEDCLLLHWNSLDYAVQADWRNFSCSLIDRFHPVLSSMPIRTKLAKLLSEIGKRQYPQLWDSFVSDLLSSWTDPRFSYRAQVSALFDFFYLHVE